MKHNGSCSKTCGHTLDITNVKANPETQRQLDRDPRVVEYIEHGGESTYTRISKREARRRWNMGETFYIIAHKMRPGFPFSMGMTIDPNHVKAKRGLTPTYPTVESLFDAAVTDFCYYNANCHETGTYAAFYSVAPRRGGTR